MFSNSNQEKKEEKSKLEKAHKHINKETVYIVAIMVLVSGARNY